MMMQSLDELMEFDTVVYSYGDGANAAKTWMATPYFEYESDDCYDIEDGWELLKGLSGQHGYGGPAFHPSEYIGGGLEKHILETPGYYCALYHLDDEGGDAWFIARKDGE